MEISPSIVDLYQKLDKIYQRRRTILEDENKIEVEDITSRVTFVYEKLRNSVDFKEAHLLRRFAIERNLRRRLILETLKPHIAKGLIEDLIRSKYLPNNTIPEKMILEVAQIIRRYGDLFVMLNDLYQGKERKQYFDWIIGVMACEIDMLLNPEDIEDSVIETMYQMVKPRVKFSGDTLREREKNVQLYISIHKSLVKSDDTIISYHLFNLYFPDWQQASSELIKIIATNFAAVYKTIQIHLKHPYQKKLLASVKEEVVTFKILYELILEKGDDLENILVQPDDLLAEAKILINKRYKFIRKKISQSSIRAIIYIFITKMVLALVLELPYEVYILQHINYLPITINVVFPPLLMFLIALTIIPPSKENTTKILENLQNIVYNNPSKSILCKLHSRYRQNWGFKIFYYSMFTILYIIVFGAIISMLRSLSFNLLSGTLFLFFLTMVSFFALKIRNTAKEYKVLQRKVGILGFFIDFFSLPIISAGRWLSTKFKKINVFAFIMDYIIEAPFKIFIAAFEEWLGFLKDKKEDIYHEE
ncbi:hypothetical protein H6761_01595 [Candidatus Nomurabacteria bacterium]|nr:hypothetical protein [Candidatus Nomurabacteria bacterium]